MKFWKFGIPECLLWAQSGFLMISECPRYKKRVLQFPPPFCFRVSTTHVVQKHWSISYRRLKIFCAAAATTVLRKEYPTAKIIKYPDSRWLYNLNYCAFTRSSCISNNIKKCVVTLSIKLYINKLNEWSFL